MHDLISLMILKPNVNIVLVQYILLYEIRSLTKFNEQLQNETNEEIGQF
mgnify:CR=1 FL=1